MYDILFSKLKPTSEKNYAWLHLYTRAGKGLMALQPSFCNDALTFVQWKFFSHFLETLKKFYLIKSNQDPCRLGRHFDFAFNSSPIHCIICTSLLGAARFIVPAVPTLVQLYSEFPCPSPPESVIPLSLVQTLTHSIPLRSFARTTIQDYMKYWPSKMAAKIWTG